MIINIHRLKRTLNKELDILVSGNLKFFISVLMKLLEWSYIQLLKVNTFYWYSFLFYTPKINKELLKLNPLMIHELSVVSYEDKLKAIEKCPDVIFFIMYPSTEMIVTYLKTRGSHTWESLMSSHEYLNDIHRKNDTRISN